jgi:hypothetical protein
MVLWQRLRNAATDRARTASKLNSFYAPQSCPIGIWDFKRVKICRLSRAGLLGQKWFGRYGHKATKLKTGQLQAPIRYLSVWHMTHFDNLCVCERNTSERNEVWQKSGCSSTSELLQT